ncbi:unnamed protein product [Schistosoma margrebowiei]|uniref:Uncharacterized protein n=1 Tax=Schistosoma margrebowiei TaxID=48269 RepID=A0A183M7D0_9TREM|nr:unnamed protein product [Schistosoma margrebowiei]
MTSNKYYDSDEIPELSPHHSGVYDEDQLEKDELKNNRMIELELARLRITQLEKEIELEKLRLQKCEGSGQYGLLVTGDPSNRNQRQSAADTKGHFDSRYKARVSFANTSESDVTPYVRPRTLGLSCSLCTGNHPLDQCERSRDKNVNERIEFVSKKKLCNVCLKANHIARNCRAPRSCAVEGCSWRHHTLLHRKREEQGDNNNEHINTQLCTEKSVERVQQQAAFAIVPVLKTISDNQDKFPRAVMQAAKEQFYVDDLLISVCTIEEAKLTYSHFKRLLSLGGFNLIKWTSVEVLEFIPEEDRAEGNIIVCESNETSKRTLGIEWNVRTDE